MRRNIAVLVFAVLVLAVGGGLSSVLVSDTSGTPIPGARVQVEDPEASVFEAEPWQAQQFILLILVIIGSLVGIGVVLAAIMWFLSRQVASVRNTAAAEGGGQAIEPAGGTVSPQKTT